MPPEKEKIVKDYIEREQFYEKFVESLIVVDPLDRVDPEKYPSMNNEMVRTVD